MSERESGARNPEGSAEEVLVLPIAEESCGPVRQALLRLCRSFDVHGDEANEVAVALSEAFSNAVLHGNGRGASTIETRLRVDPTGCQVDLRYPGEPFAADAPSLPDDSSTGGRGRFLMNCFADSVRYAFDNGLTQVTLQRRWRGV